MAPRPEEALRAVGVRAGDQAVYRALLERPGAGAEELAELTRGSAAGVRRALVRLEDLGLVSRSPGTPRRYSPTLPEAAVEALLHTQERALEQARIAAAELTALFRASMPGGKPAELVEVVTGREAVARRFLQLQKGAREELAVFDRPPYATDVNTAEAEVLARGVRYRAVYAAAAVDIPGRLDAILGLVAAGEEARVLPSVPVKLALADASLALMPASLQPGNLGHSAVVVHASPLLEALVTLFGALWERAVPLHAPAQAPVVADGGAGAGLDGCDRRVLALLTAGCKDEAIARQLGMSPRTVRRRVRSLMQRLGASTRFQAGMQAARRGLV